MQADVEIDSLCTKFFKTLKISEDEQNKVFSTVLYFIHSAPHLSVLYLNWTNLYNHEKCVLNRQMKPSVARSGKFVYPPVIRAFEYWDMIQDIYGAPGYTSNPLKGKLSDETDTEIVKTLIIMEKMINQIELKRRLLTELLAHTDPHSILYSYKWRIICKNMNRKRSLLTNTKESMSKPGESSNTGNDSTDLNGCGDTTWFSDAE